MRFTTSIPPLRNQDILITPVISVSTSPYSSQYFLTMNSSILSSALETKICSKIMIINYILFELFHDGGRYHEPLLVCLQLVNFSPFPKTNKLYYCCNLFFCFFVYIVSVGKPTFMMILYQMMDILWQTAVSVANSTTRRG